jgi:sulfur-carrier protein
MARIRLRAPLKERAGGEAEHELDGSTVGEVLQALERRYPKVTGWILDEHGRVRQHVNVFVNGERVREDAELASSDVVQVLPSISGGAER